MKKSRLITYLFWAVAVIAAGWIVVDSLPEVQDFVSLRHDLGRLEERVADLDRKVTALRDDIAHLEKNPRTYETLAREQLGMIYPDETVFVIDDMSEH